MENTKENPVASELTGDLPVRTENIAYASEEMIACEKCRRQNPPNRLKCLYCGAELTFTDEQSSFLKPVLRKLEAWEKGFNLIYLPSGAGALGEPEMKEIGRMTRLEKDVLEQIFAAGKPLPVARAESEKEARIVGQRLGELGVETALIGDEELAADRPPTRLRGLEFSGETLILKPFNTDAPIELHREQLTLIVTGAVFEKRIEAMEKLNKKGENTLLSATETATDEKLFDLYARTGGKTGFRVEQNGFDFSPLGAEKSLLAAENIDRLARKLAEFAPQARFIEDYTKLRGALGAVWEISERRDSKGLVRERFGRFSLGNVTTVSNAEQFTKYSRMLNQVLK